MRYNVATLVRAAAIGVLIGALHITRLLSLNGFDALMLIVGWNAYAFASDAIRGNMRDDNQPRRQEVPHDT